jgi:RNA polymerase sigma factor (sigma-70 family)
MAEHRSREEESRTSTHPGGRVRRSRSDCEGPRWPLRFKELAAHLKNPDSDSALDAARGEAWILIASAIREYALFHCRRFGTVSDEDLEDLAAEKSLDLLRKVEMGMWAVEQKSASEIRGYVSTAARNGLCDRLRELGRRVIPADEDEPEWELGDSYMSFLVSAAEPPDLRVECREFVEALRRCVENLKAHTRLAWFLRMFYEMSSKEIAAHPGVRLKVSHVDVLLQRSRKAIGDCMHRRGFDAQDMPAGTFVELWQVFPTVWATVVRGGKR